MLFEAALFALCFTVSVYGLANLPVPTQRQQNVAVEDDPAIKYVTRYMPVQLDHFNIANTSTFDLKLLINDTFFRDGSPLFFYTGNEGTVENFASNTGIMFDIAPDFNALIVFAEHRYYGANSSQPFNADSFKDNAHARYLTVEQTLADYAEVIMKLQNDREYNYTFGKVIAFGGSYGGMLSSWFRLKYPHIVDGVWAGSAPVAYFEGSHVPLGGFHSVVTRTMETFGCKNESVVAAFDMLRNWSSDNFVELNEIFNVVSYSAVNNTDDVLGLIGYIQEAAEYMAMVGYPYATNFLVPLDAWPMRKACTQLSSMPKNETDAARALRYIVDAYFGDDSTVCFVDSCGDPATANLGLGGWTYQSCTQIAIDICAQGPPNDVFTKQCDTSTFEEFFKKDSCNALAMGDSALPGYSTNLLDFRAIETRYGFNLDGASNIILTNGKLDPWSAGAPQLKIGSTTKNNIYSYTIDGAAHHLDLRTPNTCDPPSITNARYQIVKILKCWVGQAGADVDCDPSKLQSELPTWSVPSDVDINTANCTHLHGQFPWGQDGTGGGTTATTAKPSFSSATLVSPLLLLVTFVIGVCARTH